jgi:hypothetical protein
VDLDAVEVWSVNEGKAEEYETFAKLVASYRRPRTEGNAGNPA